MSDQEFFAHLIGQIAGNAEFAPNWDTPLTDNQRREAWAKFICEYAESLLKTAIEDFGLNLMP